MHGCIRRPYVHIHPTAHFPPLFLLSSLLPLFSSIMYWMARENWIYLEPSQAKGNPLQRYYMRFCPSGMHAVWGSSLGDYLLLVLLLPLPSQVSGKEVLVRLLYIR
jgi:hypothetical protein